MLSRIRLLTQHQQHKLPRFTSLRSLATTSSGGDDNTTTNDPTASFKPRRRPPKTYRPIPTRSRRKGHVIDPDDINTRRHAPIALDAVDGIIPSVDPDLLDYYGSFEAPVEKYNDPLIGQFGQRTAEGFHHLNKLRERGGPASIDSELRSVNYLTADPGSTEDKIGERRALMDADSEEEKKDLVDRTEEYVKEHMFDEFGLGDDDMTEIDPEKEGMVLNERDPNRKVFGEWGETVVKVDRVQKVQRGGTMVRYRCLVIGGNCKGVGGFGVGKAADPRAAADQASRKCKQNIFFFDRYQSQGLVRDLVGKHNSCKVTLRAVSKGRGLKGHWLIQDILGLFGVADCSAKSHGNRNVYNVVYATFKALMTHESIEEISLRTGKRYLNIDRARRLEYE